MIYQQLMICKGLNLISIWKSLNHSETSVRNGKAQRPF